MKIATAPVVAGLVVVLVAVSGAGAWAFTQRDDSAQTRGACESVLYELAVENDDDGREVTFDLTSSGPGEIWQVRITQDNATLFDGQRTTDTDGEIDLDLLARSAGAATFIATATAQDGSTCTAEVRHG